MKKLISIILFLTMVGILTGCAGMQTYQSSDSLANEVGKSTFVGGVPFHVDPKFALITP